MRIPGPRRRGERARRARCGHPFTLAMSEWLFNHGQAHVASGSHSTMKASTKLSVRQFVDALLGMYVVVFAALALLVVLSGSKLAYALPVNALLVTGVFAVGVAIHEAAHAITALIVGLDVTNVRIGLGPVVWRGSPWGVDIEIRSVPFSGATLAIPKASSWVRLRYFLTIAAGPAVNACVSFGVLRLVGWSADRPPGDRAFIQAAAAILLEHGGYAGAVPQAGDLRPAAGRA